MTEGTRTQGVRQTQLQVSGLDSRLRGNDMVRGVQGGEAALH